MSGTVSGTVRPYPYSAVVRITVQIAGITYWGTGVLISPDEVLTASHLLYVQGTGEATNIMVLPDYEAASSNQAPFGTIQGVSDHYNPIADAA